MTDQSKPPSSSSTIAPSSPTVPIIPATMEAPEGLPTDQSVAQTITTPEHEENKGFPLGHSEKQMRRPQDSHIVTPGDIHAERSGLIPKEEIDQKLREQHIGERTAGEGGIITHTLPSTSHDVKKPEEEHHHPHPHGQGLISGGGNISMGLRK